MLGNWVDTTVGCIVLVVALAANLALVLWSRRRIQRIHSAKGRTLREIKSELGGE